MMSQGGLYLFLGPDRPRKLQRLHALERTLQVSPLDRHQLDAATTTAPELIALCRQQPAASQLRLIAVDNAQRLETSCVEALLQHADAIVRSACVLLLVDVELNARHALSKAGSPLIVEQFPLREASATRPFAFTDALGNRDLGGALVALREQLLDGREPLELLGLVGWQLQRWIVVKRLLQTGSSAEGIAAVAGLRPWQVQRLQSELAHRPLAQLQHLLGRCWELDTQAKRGQTIAAIAVEHLIMEICLSPERVWTTV